MTIANETSRSGPYFGNGVTTAFDYDFRILAASHISVVATDADGDEIPLVLDADYSVTGVGDDQGQVIMAVAPASGVTIVLLLDVPFTQEVDLENQGAYYAETVELALDLAAMRAQQLKEKVDRSLVLPPDESVSAEEILGAVTRLSAIYLGPHSVAPTTRNDGSPLQGGDLYFSTVTSQINTYDGAAWRSLTDQTLNVSPKAFTGTGAQTTFVLDRAPGVVANLFVALNGVIKRPITDYAVAGSNLTFAVAPGNGVAIDTWVFTTSSTIGAIAANAVNTAAIQNGAVTDTKLADGAATTAKIADLAVTFGKIAAAALATVGELLLGTANKLVSAATLKSAVAFGALTDGASVAWDMSTGVHKTLAANGSGRTVENPTNVTPGYGFILEITAVGSTRSIAFASNWKKNTKVEALPLSVTTAETATVHGYVKDAGNIIIEAITRR